MRMRFYLLIGLLALLGLPTDGTSQFPGGGMGSGRGFGDPSRLFDMMSGGKDVITRDSLPNPWMQGMFDRFAQNIGVTDGKITRAQFNAYMQQKMAASSSSSFSSSSGGGPTGFVRSSSSSSQEPGRGGPPPGAGGFKRGSSEGGSSFNPADMMDRWAEGMFQRLDANGDGLLNYDEMSETLRTERDKWDMNRDGFIDLHEYKPYVRGVMQQRLAERGGSSMFSDRDGALPLPVPTAPIEEEEPKPTVWRAGKLPKELPVWFQTVDADADGQVSLYEWRSAGKVLDEFRTQDRNGDGFLTIAEVLYHAGGKNNLNGVAVVTASGRKNSNDGSAAERMAENRGSDGKTSESRSFPNSADSKGSRGGPWGSRFGR